MYLRKSTIHTLIICFISVFLLTPIFSGLLFKRHYQYFIAVLNKEQGVKIEILDYHLGWFESTSQIKISLLNEHLAASSAIPLAPVTFIVDQRFIHGPIVYDPLRKSIQIGYAKIFSNIHLDNVLEKAILGTENVLGSGIMKVESLSKLNGDWIGEFTTPLLYFDIQPLGKFSISGITGKFKLVIDDDKLDQMQVNFKIGNVGVNVDPENTLFSDLKIQSIFYRYNSAHETIGLWSGSTNIFTKGISVTLLNGNKVDVNSVNINTKFGVTKDTFYNTTVVINIKNIKRPGAIIDEIAPLYVSVSADNFSAEGMTDYIYFIRHQLAEAIKTVDLTTIQKLLVQTVMTNSVLNTEVNFKTNLGECSSQSKSMWKTNAPAPRTPQDILLNSLTQIDVKCTDSLVNQFMESYTKVQNTGDAPVTDAVVKTVSELNQPKTPSTTPPADQFSLVLAQLLQANKITIGQFVKVLNLEKQKPSLSAFNDNIDQLNLPIDIANQLKSAYVAEQKSPLLDPNINLQAAERVLRNLITIGLIRQENHDYITTIRIENGELKINASVINLQ